MWIHACNDSLIPGLAYALLSFTCNERASHAIQPKSPTRTNLPFLATPFELAILTSYESIAGRGPSALLVAFLLLASAAGGAEAREHHGWDRLDPNLDWQVGRIAVSGNSHFSSRDLERKMQTRERPWYTPWRSRAAFDPATIEQDMQRLTRFYEAEGYFQSQITFDWHAETKGNRIIVDVTVSVIEGPRAEISALGVSSVEVPGGPAVPADLDVDLAADIGAAFREEDYQKSEHQLENVYLEEGFASVEIERRAVVSRDRQSVALSFEVQPGDLSTIRSIEVVGTEHVAVELVTRELTFARGEIFSISRIRESRANLLALGLFSSVRIEWHPDSVQLAAVAVVVTVREQGHREFRVGVGYSTDEQARAQLRWLNDNFWGGGRRLALTSRYSKFVRAVDISFTQPHFFERHTRGLLNLVVFQEDERSYTRNSIEVEPAVDHTFDSDLLVNLGLRIDTAQVRDVTSEVTALIGGVRSEGLVVGPTLMLRWSPVDNLFRPTRGWVATGRVAASSTLLGATYDYYKSSASLARYHPLGDWAVLAARIELGVADSFSAPDRLPIFERFYAGGERSVRGYQRRQLGPRASNGDPLGG